jgi:hypothetical protein
LVELGLGQVPTVPNPLVGLGVWVVRVRSGIPPYGTNQRVGSLGYYLSLLVRFGLGQSLRSLVWGYLK